MSTVHEVNPEEVMALHDGELSGERAQLVSAHLDSCSECRVVAKSLRGVSEAVASWTIPAARPSLQPGGAETGASSRETGDALGPSSLWQTSHKRRLVLSLAAIAATAVFVCTEIGRLGRTPAQSVARQIFTPIDLNSQQNLQELERQGRAAGGGGGEIAHQYLQRRVEFPPATAPATRSPRQGLADAVGVMAGKAPASADDSAETMIARSAELQIVVEKFEASRATLEAILIRHRGYAASLNVGNAENTARSLSGSLRIPARELPAVLSELKSLGHVTHEYQSGEEVTAEHADLLARLKNARETETRLLDILRSRTGKVSEVLEVEQEISRVRGEIEQMESERKTMEHRVDFATVSLTITEEYKAKVSDSTPGAGTRFHNATIAGLENVKDSALGLVLWFAEYLPPILFWLLPLAVPAAFFWRVRRRVITAASTF